MDSVTAVPNQRIYSSDLCDLAETYLPPEQVRMMYKAYLFSALAHEGQSRLSGEPYIFHPLAVAYTLAEMGMDVETLAAALLHDVLEDTPVSKMELIEAFGEEVAELVDGVSKLKRVPTDSVEEHKADNFRKMILAMSRDIRVMIIKLADRLHNLRTAEAKSPGARRRIAKETTSIYTQIADRLGMNAIKTQLEELCFCAYHPFRHRILSKHLHTAYNRHAEAFKQIQATIQQRLAREKLEVQVELRVRQLHSIYADMSELKKSGSAANRRHSFAYINRTCNLRILADTVDTCYRVLGMVHNLYRPRFDGFRDYIAVPKENGYQALHTELMGAGTRIDVQILTASMYSLSETGIVEAYRQNHKQGSQQTDKLLVHAGAKAWLTGLVNINNNSDNSLEFLDRVKSDLIPNDVFVYTPKGEIIRLPQNATALDFAYAIHTDIGNTCVAMKIDNHYAPLSTPLKSGQVVEAISMKWSKPNHTWLSFVVTSRARIAIHQYLRNYARDSSMELGKRMLDKELSSYHLTVDSLSEAQTKHLLDAFHCPSLSQLLVDIGLGHRSAFLVARYFDTAATTHISLPATEFNDFQHPPQKTKPLLLKGTEGSTVTFSRCCCPIPGDEVVGVISAGRGILVHTISCKNAVEYHKQPEKWMQLEWDMSNIEGEFPVDLQLHVRNQRGIIGDISVALNNLGVDIKRINDEDLDGVYSALKLTINVKNRTHLATIIRYLRRLSNVLRIQRKSGG